VPCKPIKVGEITGIVCTRSRRRRRPCRWCDALATRLCDRVKPGRSRPCNAPMCDQHATSVGDDLDHCPDCVKAAAQLPLF